jgi:peptidyl-prolyl cis-trans isomerase D
MFDFVRSHQKVLQFVLVLLIFPSFVFFGVQGYSRFSEEGAKPVAEVDGRPITGGEWDQAHQRSIERMRQQMPGIDAKLLDSPELKKQTLDSLVRERVLMAAAVRDHLQPGDERLARLFRTDPQFAGLRNPDGSVNREFLTAQGLSSEGFAQQLRGDLGMRQVLAGVTGAVGVPKASAALALDALLQRREIDWVRFDPRAYQAKLQPTAAELEGFFKEQEARFRLPEEAQIEYVLLDLPTVSKTISVSPEDLRRYYEENQSRYTKAEERRASHILIKADKTASAADRQAARQQAEALLAEVRRTPARFADLARKNSQDPGSAAQGGDLDFFGRGAMVKPFEDTVFAMKAGEISNLIETDFGYHIIQMTATRGGEKQPFEVVKAEIEAEIRKQGAQRKFAEAAEQFTNTVYEQADSLQPVIDKLKLDKRTASVRRQPGPQATGPLASQKLLDAIFGADTLKNKRNTEAVDLGGSQLVSARVLQYTPARVPPFDDVKEAVRAAVIEEQALALARKEGLAKLEALKQAPATALPQSAVLSRGQAQGVPRPLIDAVLLAPQDKLPAPIGVDLGAGGYVVARVLKVLPREQTASTDALLAPQLAQAWSAAESEAYLATLKRRFKVEVKATARSAEAPAKPASQ